MRRCQAGGWEREKGVEVVHRTRPAGLAFRIMPALAEEARRPMAGEGSLVPGERIATSILMLRGHKVMLSTDLAELYQVEPRVLVQAVKRNSSRFPGDFMFQLSEAEFAHLKSQTVTSSSGGPGCVVPTPCRSYAFTAN